MTRPEPAIVRSPPLSTIKSSSDKAVAPRLDDAMADMLDTFNLASPKTPRTHNKLTASRSEKDAMGQPFLSPRTSSLVFTKEPHRVATKTLASLNGHLEAVVTSTNPFVMPAKRPEVVFLADQLAAPYKHLFVKLPAQAALFDARIEQYGDWARETLLSEGHVDVASEDRPSSEWTHPGFPSASQICTYGKLWSDTEDGKWNERAVLLETSRALGSGAKVRLLLAELPSYSFFPGQLVAAWGVAAMDGFHVKSLIPPSVLPRPLTRQPATTAQRLIVAAGPFVFYDEDARDLSAAPLDMLLAHAAAQQAAVVLLLGPFIDADALTRLYIGATHEMQETPEVLFRRHITTRINAFVTRETACAVLLMPSLKDVLHDYVYPQGPLRRRDLGLHEAVTLLPNPCFFCINELVVAATTVDTLFDLSCHEIAKVPVDAQAGSDRMARLVRHLLQQRCFYPMSPSSTAVNLDYGHFAKALSFPVLPDLLLLPSQLKYFAKNVDDVVCVNPGLFLKGSSAGTFVDVLVHPLSLSSATSDAVPNLLEARARVDILQFS